MALRWILVLLFVLTAVHPHNAEASVSKHEVVLNHDFPDPTLMLALDGYYYAYATQGYTEFSTPRILNMQIARSKDLKTWQHLGEALPVKPDWAQGTQNFWAPHIYYSAVQQRYLLYYSAEPDTRSGLCLAVAVSDKPEGPFTDIGSPLKCGPSFSNIDPMIFDDTLTGKTLLYWGSAFEPIRVQELDKDLLDFEKGTSPTYLLEPDKGPSPLPYMRLLEGAWLHQQDGYYYMFVSGENCCVQPNPQYAVLVARSKSVWGPFEWKNGDPRQSVVIESDRLFSATGHNALIKDRSGQLWSFYHGVDANQPNLARVIAGDRTNRRVLLRTKIDFRDGWPYAH